MRRDVGIWVAIALIGVANVVTWIVVAQPSRNKAMEEQVTTLQGQVETLRKVVSDHEVLWEKQVPLNQTFNQVDEQNGKSIDLLHDLIKNK